MRYMRYLIAMAATLGLAILVVSFFTKNEGVVAATFAQMSPPTPAPTRTPGAPVRTTPKPIPTLAQPLSEEVALKQAMEIDSAVAVWDKSWSVDTLRLDPGRITILRHADRSYDGNQYPPDKFETGPVWTITIKGNVKLRLPGTLAEEYDSVTYTIAQKTGDLLRVQAGLPTSNQPFLPKTATPSYQLSVPGTPAALTSSSCTQNPSGLAIRVTQQPGKSSIPGAAGPVYSFLIEGTGFMPGEKVSIVIQGRVTVPGSMGSTAETVLTDSTFATTVGVAVTQSNMPVDFFVIHRRGVACVTVTATQ